MNKTGANELKRIVDYIQRWSTRKANTSSEPHIALAIDHIKANLPPRAKAYSIPQQKNPTIADRIFSY